MKEARPLEVFKVPLNGVSLVEASAGTGKTYNITSLYVRAILEQDLEPSQVLVMTFTEAATAELKYRLRARLQDSLKAVEDQNPGEDEFLVGLLKMNYPEAENKLRGAIRAFDESAVFTIHGFCNRLLSEYSLQFDVPPNFEVLADPSELLQDCVDQYWRSFIQTSDHDKTNWAILDYLTDVGFGPDELRKAVDTVLTHPRSKVVPENLSNENLEDSLKELNDLFTQLKSVWKQEGEMISDMYLNGKLNGQAFRKGKTWQEDWDNLMALLSSPEPRIGISDRMTRFGSYMKDRGSKKDFEVPDLQFFGLMDAYVEMTDRLRSIKPAFIREAVEEIRSLFEQQKRKANVLSYDDLLEITERGLRNDSNGYLTNRLSEKYPLALVDEFQDTDPIQYSIFRHIYYGKEDRGLFMIGDPKQSIYGFRGADIFTYLSAKKDVKEEHSYNLIYNYRSNEKMIEGVNSFFNLSEDPFLLDDLPFYPAQFPDSKEDTQYLTDNSGDLCNPMQFIELNEDYYTDKNTLKSDIYDTVSKEIAELLSGDYSIDKEKVKEKDIAILVREGNEGEVLQSSLRKFGISSVLRSRTSVFKTVEAEELFRVLSAVQKISYEPGIRAALASSILGFTAEDLAELNSDEARWGEVIRQFLEVREIWEDRGIDAALDELFRTFRVKQRISKAVAAERRISNLLHLTELLSKAAREQQLGSKALMKWFFTKTIQEDSKDSSEDEQLRLESDEGLVQITTIHSSKGLQYPIVFCPFLWSSKASPKKDDILKFYKDDSIHIDISQDAHHPDKEEHSSLTELQNQAEDVRLAYVALTRAISACYIILPNYRDVGDSPFGFILSDQNSKDEADFGFIKENLEQAEYIKVRGPVNQPKNVALSENKAEKSLSARMFSRNDVFNIPRVLSYSGLSGNNESDEIGRDYDDPELNIKRDIERDDRFGFPKGANAGTCLHNILEDLSFEDPLDLDRVVEKNLNYSGIDEKWKNVTENWISDILNHPLQTPGVTLSGLKNADVLKEMEFFFPVSDLKASDLWKIIRGDVYDAKMTESVFGYMKGYIDLTFMANGKFFILDYKSNYLGDQPDDYNQSSVKQAVSDAGYDLQYHIYTLALHRYLKERMSGYDYEKHFGGVLYLFLRGMDHSKPNNGVYFDVPKAEVVQSLDDYFRGVRRI